MNMNETRVNSWSELQDKLFEESWRPDIQRYRSPYAFRGQSDSNHRLDTTLMRLGGDYAEMEKHLLRNFRKYASRNEVDDDRVWNWLSLAKHHGLPTRLVDWSFSPLVAMHFATGNLKNYHLDGAIWAVNYIQVHQFLPGVLRDELVAEGSDVFTVDMLSEVASSLAEFDQLAPEDFAVFFEPPSIDARIVNQFALFSMISNPTAVHDDWLQKHPELFQKIIIPAGIKWEIRDKLDQANITERVLFPGLDGLSTWLRRQYSSRK